jgi:hypothetical protein
MNPKTLKDFEEDLLTALPAAGAQVGSLVSKYVADPSGFGPSNARAALLQLAEDGVVTIDNAGNVLRLPSSRCSSEVRASEVRVLRESLAKRLGTPMSNDLVFIGLDGNTWKVWIVGQADIVAACTTEEAAKAVARLLTMCYH